MATIRIACFLRDARVPPPAATAHTLATTTPKAVAPLEAFAEACLQLSPQLALRQNEAVFLEIGKCRNLISDEGVKLRLQVLARRFGLSGKIAIAQAPGWALARARYGM